MITKYQKAPFKVFIFSMSTLKGAYHYVSGVIFIQRTPALGWKTVRCMCKNTYNIRHNIHYVRAYLNIL